MEQRDREPEAQSGAEGMRSGSADPREHHESSIGRSEGGYADHGGRSSGTIGTPGAEPGRQRPGKSHQMGSPEYEREREAELNGGEGGGERRKAS